MDFLLGFPWLSTGALSTGVVIVQIWPVVKLTKKHVESAAKAEEMDENSAVEKKDTATTLKSPTE